MHTDENLIMISALQHLLYCERRCALVHVEQLWAENIFTVRGDIMHEKAHSGDTEYRDGIRIERSVPLRSLRLGLVGQADVVEFHETENGIIPYPVEYKLGKPKSNRCDEVQLCAQALCLEEMMNCNITEGALFYGKTKRRHVVTFDKELRNLTEKCAVRLHEIIDKGYTPPPVYNKKKCDNCSLKGLCIPEDHGSAKKFMEKIINEETS
jgi:CRISPR-associated exonuclease Cas4